MNTENENCLIPYERISAAILEIRSKKVMLDFELAELYDVENKLLIRAVRRNIERCPDDFMFQLSDQEVAALRIQFGSARLPNIAYRSATGDSLHTTPASPIS